MPLIALRKAWFFIETRMEHEEDEWFSMAWQGLDS